MQVRLSRGARRDLKQILRHSELEFGETVRTRYKQLLDQAIADLADDAGRVGVRCIDEVRSGYFVYHLKWAKARVGPPTIRRPRHLLVFRILDEFILLAAVAHERELIEHHLDQ